MSILGSNYYGSGWLTGWIILGKTFRIIIYHISLFFIYRYWYMENANLFLHHCLMSIFTLFCRMENSKSNAQANKRFLTNNKSKSADVDQEVSKTL